jgi:phospholipase C
VRFSHLAPAALGASFCAAVGLAACSRGDLGPSLNPAVDTLLAGPEAASRAHSGPRAPSPIKHVVIVMQENRSFDNLFQGYPGADTQPYGYDLQGDKIKLRPVSLAAKYGIDHFSQQFFAAYDGGKMDGFDQETYDGPAPPHPAYGYVPHAESALYFQMAGQYVLADRMFTSNIDASFVSHQYIIAGQAQRSVDLPSIEWGCDGTGGDFIGTLKEDRNYGPDQFPCFDYTTLGDELDAAGLTWRYYTASPTDIWSGYQAVSHIYNGPDWANVIAPDTKFLSDVAAGTLSNVTWITPTCETSDHAGCRSKKGPEWVASIVDAVGQSPFWNSTAIFVMWDEWGGWYDHVPPPYVDYDGLGIRVPLLIVSPYAKAGYVSHVQYEHGSILKFAEDQFGLARLSHSDSRAHSPEDDSFDFRASPRPFQVFGQALKARDWERTFPDRRPPDSEG